MRFRDRGRELRATEVAEVVEVAAGEAVVGGVDRESSLIGMG